MSTFRPPSTSPSPGPCPSPKIDAATTDAQQRASMGPAARVAAIPSPSPRPGVGLAARPTSELLGSASMFQTPEAEALDQWFKNLQSYEATLEEMAAASLDVNFKEELSAIEQWVKVLSEAERTAALYSLLQHSTQVQIRFFITVLQQMARSDPMTALLSPAVGGSMQTQMEAKLASMSLKSPGLKSTMPGSPTVRNLSPSNNLNRQSVAVDTTSHNFLSPDSAALASTGHDAAATLAQQRAKLKASNAAHRISAPVLSSPDGRGAWNPPGQLGQVAEQNSSAQEIVVNGGNRPQSVEYSSTLPAAARSGQLGAEGTALSPRVGDSWASMVNTPLIPMFQKDAARTGANLDAAAAKLNDWGGAAGVPRMGDPKIYRRQTKPANAVIGNDSGAMYDNDGNPIQMNHQQGQGQQQQQQHPGRRANMLHLSPSVFGGNNPGWNGARTPGSGDGSAGALGLPNGFGMGLGMGSAGLGIPGVGMPGLGVGGMGQLSPFMMNMAAMGMTPEAQLLAAQMAAASGFGPNNWMNMPGVGVGGLGSAMLGNRSAGRTPGSARSVNSKASSNNGGSALGTGKRDEEDFDPQILSDVPAWLRSLRLHKYTPNFEGMKWQEIVGLDEAALEKQGVAALGARRKMLKTFEVVRKKMGLEVGPPPATA